MDFAGVIEMYVVCIDSKNFLIYHQDYMGYTIYCL